MHLGGENARDAQFVHVQHRGVTVVEDEGVAEVMIRRTVERLLALLHSKG